MANFRTSVKAISPGFLRAGTGERYMYTIGLMLDALMQKMVEGQIARMPMKCAPAFLPIIGSDRLIGQGISESTDSYRVRLRKAFESWQLAGSARSVMVAALGYLLADTPRVRMVSSRYSGNVADLLFVRGATNASPIVVTVSRPNVLKTGDTVTITGVLGNTATNTTATVTVISDVTFTLDGTTGNGAYTSGGVVASALFPSVYPMTLLSSTWGTYTAGQDPGTAPVHVLKTPASLVGVNWDWDSLSQVIGSWGWWGSWFIVYATTTAARFHASGKWGTGVKWGSGPAWGVTENANVARSLVMIVGQWKPAHAWIRWLIVSFDNSLFDPESPVDAGVNPDGTFGKWSKVVNGAYVPSRFANARYGDGVL